MLQVKNTNSTVVTTMGKVLHVGNGHDGVLVVDEQDEKPVFGIGEVSDDETIQVFLNFPKGAAVRQYQHGDPDVTVNECVIEEESIYGTHEILISRKDHQPLRLVDAPTAR